MNQPEPHPPLNHPAFRWCATGDGWTAAHRLLPDLQMTACGLLGPFTQAGTDKALCQDCYPNRRGRLYTKRAERATQPAW